MKSFQQLDELITTAELFCDGDWVESKDQDEVGTVRLIQLADIGDGEFLDKSSRHMNIETAKRLNCTFLNKGDILIARMPDPIGRSCIFPFDEKEKYVTVVDVAVLRVTVNFDKSYIRHLINTPNVRHEIEQQTTGTTRSRITRKKLEKIKIPLPPLAEQKQIAAILDAADALRQKDQQLVEHYTQLSQSLFLDMFGDFIENPKGFNQDFLGNVLPEKNSIKCGPFGSQLKIGEFVDKGIPVYGIDNVQINKFISAKPKYITDDKFNDLVAFNVKENDVLISRTGTVGRTCLAPNVEKAVIGPNLLKVRVQNEKFNPSFLAYSFNYSESIKRQIEMFSPGATVAVYNTGNLKKLKVLVPPITLQNQFAERVEKIEQQKQQAQANLEKSNDLFNALLQKAFTGELTQAGNSENRVGMRA